MKHVKNVIAAIAKVHTVNGLNKIRIKDTRRKKCTT